MAQEQYLIRVKGHLGQQWNEWFDGFTITNVDQAALHGVLVKVRDLGLPLLGVSRVVADELPGG